MPHTRTIVVIVGHPTSGYGMAGRLLFSFGMAAAMPSRRKNRSAAEITQTLCKTFDCTPLQSRDDTGKLEILQVQPQWHTLADGLWESNEELSFWGWSDPAALHLLPYWCDAQPDLRVVLVYDDPASLFSRSCATGDDMAATGDTLEDRQAQWQAYNSALLHFYMHNRERCVLMHGGRLESLFSQHSNVRQEPAAQRLLQQLGVDTSAPVGKGTKTRTSKPQALSLLAQPLYGQLAALWPGMRSISARLDAVADLPPLAPEEPDHQTQLDQLQKAWHELQTRQASEQLANVALQQENTLLVQQLHSVQAQLEILSPATARLPKTSRKVPDSRAQSPRQPSAAGRKREPTTRSHAQGRLERLKARLVASRQARRLSVSDLFDARWYLAQYPDIANTRRFTKNPALHYLLHGANEGRDPSAAFSTRSYLSRYPDVRKSGINPLLHYLCHGQAEGRLP